MKELPNNKRKLIDILGGEKMKKIIFPVLTMVAGLPLLLTEQYLPAYAAYNVIGKSELVSTINLNDCTNEEIRAYYSSLNSLNDSERQGNNLLKNLKPILANGQKTFSYESNANIWKAYEITDRDWEKSPASAIAGYNPTTNIITGYEYGKNDCYVHALYANRNVDNKATAMGDHTSKNLAWGTNQEHVWAKSNGFENKGSYGARGDLMHLISGIGRVNQTEHNDEFFGFVDLTKEYITPTKSKPTEYAHLSGNYRGISKTVGSGTVFEPQDADKGDIARAIFYMVARYNDIAGGDIIDSNNPNLELVQLSERVTQGAYQSTNTLTGKMGIISDLLAWNKLDPVDDYEIHRNNILYRNYSFNRNPFIDFPEWADCIWGTANIDGTGYNPTVSKSANPAVDSINDVGFDVSTKEVHLQKGESFVVKGNNADDDITWTVDDPTIVSLDKYTSTNNQDVTITALKDGETIIRASAYTAGDLINKTITVKVKEISKISVSGAKKDFKVGDKFSTEGLTVTVTYNDNSTEVITSGYTVSEPDMSKVGKQIVKVTYKTFSAEYEINIADKTFFEKYQLYIIIGGVAVVVIIGIIVFATGSKKTKRKMKSAVKKGVKSYTKNKKK